MDTSRCIWYDPRKLDVISAVWMLTMMLAFWLLIFPWTVRTFVTGVIGGLLAGAIFSIGFAPPVFILTFRRRQLLRALRAKTG